MPEKLLLVNNRNEVIGYDTKDICHEGMGKLHRAFSILIFTSDGRLLLQRRSSHKLLWPKHWSNSVCSHPRKDEEIEEAAQRRLAEEIGINTPIHFLYTFQYHASYLNIGSEAEMCSVFFGIYDGAISPDSNEIEDICYANIEQVMMKIERSPESFTPWFKMEWEHILRNHMNQIKSFIKLK
jgi:isopentenyl-diphosphate delta-isomerase